MTLPMCCCVQEGLPLLSRTIRLAADVPQLEINRYLRSETQRTLISAGGQMAHPAKISHVVIVGNESQTAGLDDVLSDHFQVVAAVVRPNSLLGGCECFRTSGQHRQFRKLRTTAGRCV